MMSATPKVVVSTTLTNPDWGPTSVISSNITAALTALKQQPGQDITVGASATLVRFLLDEHLLDELRLLVHPVVAGTGKRLFAETGSRVPLALESQAPPQRRHDAPLLTGPGPGHCLPRRDQGFAGCAPWLMRSSRSPGWRRSTTTWILTVA